MSELEKKPSTGAFILAFTAIYLIWGSTYLGIRIAVSTMPPFAMAGARFFVAGLVMFAILRARGTAWPSPRQ
ncbi:MAG TPA: EamA family transporter, partial [Opitutaceae bacterium]